MSDYRWEDTLSAARAVAGEYDIPVNYLLAIAEIESRNDPGMTNKPVIRVEPHWFKKYVSAKQYNKAKGEGLFQNPRSQVKRWENFRKLEKIDAFATYLSHSFGVMQVMGFNYETCGFKNVKDLVTWAMSGPHGQYELGARFLKANGLVSFLKNGDLEKFAHRYNGPKWRENNYVAKLKAALKKHAGAVEPRPVEPPRPVVPQGQWGWLIALIAAGVAAALKAFGVW